MSAFGSQSMALPLKRVIMRLPDRVMAGAERDVWHYGPQFDPRKADRAIPRNLCLGALALISRLS